MCWVVGRLTVLSFIALNLVWDFGVCLLCFLGCVYVVAISYSVALVGLVDRECVFVLGLYLLRGFRGLG